MQTTFQPIAVHTPFVCNNGKIMAIAFVCNNVKIMTIANYFNVGSFRERNACSGTARMTLLHETV